MDLLQMPVASALFVLLFVASAINYVRRRNRLTGAVVLVFAASALVFVGRLLAVAGISLPTPLGVVSLLALLAQPVLSLRLAGLLHPIGHRVLPLAWIGYAISAALVAVSLLQPAPGFPPPLIVVVLGVYVATAVTAAGYFWVAARERVGSGRTRLRIAAGAAILMAATLLLVGAGAAITGESPVLSTLSRYGTLLGAVAYALAFIPPGWLRRQWQARTAYELSRRVLAISTAEDAAVTWQRFAQLVAGAAGVRDTAVLLGDTEQGAELVAATGRMGGREHVDGAAFAELVAIASDLHQARTTELPPPVGGALAGLTEDGVVSFVSFDGVREQAGVLVIAARSHSLFSRDDHDLFAMIAAEAAILADRARAAAEHAELASRLAAAVDALRSANQAKNDFLANMSHELRTPLNAILGFSDLMRDEPLSDGRRTVPADWIDHVRKAGEHLLGLINDVLDLAKVEAGRLDLRLETVDARSAVSEALAELRPLALAKDITLSSEVEVDAVFADRARLRQILYNLLSNAIKFTPQGGEVRVEGVVASGMASLSVVDTGVGIARENYDRVFEEFIQVGDLAARTSGTGLGLALTRRLIEAHGGHIDIASVLGEGSRFTVTLPLVESANEAQVNRPFAMPSSLGVPTRGGQRSVLVIEDDAQAAALLRTYLEPDGYHVSVATDGVGGIAAARRERPSAILLDVLLMGIDGWEVLRRLKADPELSDIPVVMVTVVDDREVGLALGATDYLLKPVSRMSLLASLNRHVRQTAESKRPRVLIADDDPSARAFVQATLEPQGYELVAVEGGREAIYTAADGSFDMIICDLLMPDLDGFEVVAQLKSAERTQETPILILTAHTLSEADKDRLNGKIVGICQKGADTGAQLRSWLRTLSAGASMAQVPS
jgi:signal transduction histidine kinase/CheY-like chemotaxis protein